MNVLLRLLTLLAVVGGSAVFLLYFFQERLLFFPELLPKDYEFHFPGNFREANLELGSGQSVNYLVFNPDSTRGVILYFHGNAGSLASWGFAAAEVATNTGWSVWIVDYPGYGKSTGPLPKNEKILFQMARALRDQAQREKPQLPLVFFGRSVGSGLASLLAFESPAAALILESPYRSIGKLGHEIYPFLPESFSRFDLNNEKLLRALPSTRVLILHGEADEVIPFAHGKFLSELRSTITLISIPKGGHNNLSDFPDYWPALIRFLE